MRPIDANALAKRMQYLIRLRTYDAFDCLNEIDAAPTIDAVPVDKISFTDLYLANGEAIATFKFGNQGITLRTECEDVVQVVRCKDCKYWEAVEYYPDGTKDVCRLLKRQTQDDCFCSYGERKYDAD